MGRKINFVKPLVSTLIAFVRFHCFHYRDVCMSFCVSFCVVQQLSYLAFIDYFSSESLQSYIGKESITSFSLPVRKQVTWLLKVIQKIIFKNTHKIYLHLGF